MATVAELIIKAQLLSQDGLHAHALDLDREIVAERPNDGSHRYNLACSLARNGLHKEALQEVTNALLLGFANTDLLEEDTDLEPLREEPAFQKLLEEAKAGKYKEGLVDDEEADRFYFGFATAASIQTAGVLLVISSHPYGVKAKSKEEFVAELEFAGQKLKEALPEDFTEKYGFDALHPVSPVAFFLEPKEHDITEMIRDIYNALTKNGHLLGDFSDKDYEPAEARRKQRSVKQAQNLIDNAKKMLAYGSSETRER